MHQEHKSQFLSVFDFINFLIDANLSAQIFEALNFFQLSFLLTSTSIRIVLVQLQRIVYIAIVYKEKDTFKFQKAIPGDARDLVKNIISQFTFPNCIMGKEMFLVKWEMCRKPNLPKQSACVTHTMPLLKTYYGTSTSCT